MALTNRQDAEQYVLDHLAENYVGYRSRIELTTTFQELERGVDSDMVGAHLFLDIEEESGIQISEDEALTLNAGDVRGVVDHIVGKLGLPD